MSIQPKGTSYMIDSPRLYMIVFVIDAFMFAYCLLCYRLPTGLLSLFSYHVCIVIAFASSALFFKHDIRPGSEILITYKTHEQHN